MKPISSDFPYRSNYLDVLGSQMHYIDVGQGDPVLFLHGNPTSAYLWRNIIPYLSNDSRCIAPDLIGMGLSDKPDIEYRFMDHVKYLDEFIRRLDLKNITLVLHDWGSALGFYYAHRFQDNVKGLVFMEGIVRPIKWKDFPLKFRVGFKLFRSPGIGWIMNGWLNMFLNQIMPQATLRKLTREEFQNYKAPFQKVADRIPVWQWPREIPIEGKPADVDQLVKAYSQFLGETDLPKLLLYAKPGGLIPEDMVSWCEENFPNLKSVYVGKGIHYIQEDHPHEIGAAIRDWYAEI